MQSGPEQLKDWMRRRGVNQSEAAELLGLDIPFMSLLVNGKRTPGLTNAIAIERQTGIPVEAWLLNEVAESPDATPSGGGKRRV